MGVKRALRLPPSGLRTSGRTPAPWRPKGDSEGPVTREGAGKGDGGAETTSGPAVSHAVCLNQNFSVCRSRSEHRPHGAPRSLRVRHAPPPAPRCAERTPQGHGTRERWRPGSRRLSKRSAARQKWRPATGSVGWTRKGSWNASTRGRGRDPRNVFPVESDGRPARPSSSLRKLTEQATVSVYVPET